MTIAMQQSQDGLRVRDLLLRADGRIGRAGFCVGALALFVWTALAQLIVGDLVALVFVWGWVCIVSRRLHDLGVSGWLQAPLHLALPLAAAGAMGIDLGFPALETIDGAILMAQLTCLVWLALIPGRPGPNRYGAPIFEVLRRW